MNKQIVNALLHMCNKKHSFGMTFNNKNQLTDILCVNSQIESMKQPAETWHSGSRPPFVGWWRTRQNGFEDLDSWRFWNGDFWSFQRKPMNPHFDLSPYTSLDLACMSWCWLWASNPRVPRIEPLAFEIIKRELPQFEDWTINQFLERIAK